jgi:phage/plasmid-like protein (TIGR03299 family)
MSTQEQTFDLLEKTGLNWTVNKLPLYGPNGQKTNSYGIFRNDSNAHLGTVGTRYVPYQNYEMAETIIDACLEFGIEASKGGMFDAGGKVYMQASLPDVIIGRSPLKRYITCLNSHDGTASIGFGSTSTNIVCMNTFHMAYKDGAMTKYRHTESAAERIRHAVKAIKHTMDGDHRLMNDLSRMADIKLTEDAARTMLNGIFKKGFGLDPKDEVSTKRKNQLVSLNNSIERELHDQGVTLWGFFNGITRYTNHVAAPASSKEQYVMDGAGYDLNLAAFDEVMAWIEKNTAKQYTFA